MYFRTNTGVLYKKKATKIASFSGETLNTGVTGQLAYLSPAAGESVVSHPLQRANNRRREGHQTQRMGIM